MTRQVIMVFYGDARWEEARAEEPVTAAAADAHDAHSVHPHESPWLMLVPLVVLAFLSTVGGALNLPFSVQTQYLARWLAPVLPAGEEIDVFDRTQLLLGIATTALVLVGILLARAVYAKRKVPAEKVEIAPLVHAWYVDEELTAFMGGPGLEAAEGASWFDRNIVDGAVNGVASLVRRGGRSLRHVQTGYVRNYALGVAVGAVILVGLLLGRV
jgi:NADH-quinone oxidoreductase subunit L